MRCPRCAETMQAFFVRGLELDRCRGCGRVWLDMNEVEREFGVTALVLGEAEIDAQCPREHGVLVESTVSGQPALACPRCRGALVDGAQSPASQKVARADPQRPKAAEVMLSCERCLQPVPLSEAAANTREGTLCRACELADPPRKPRKPLVGGATLNYSVLIDAVLDALQLILRRRQ